MIQEKTSTAVEHSHRWHLDTPSGLPTVEGICRACGASKTFPASMDFGGLRDMHIGGRSGRELDLGRGESWGFAVDPARKGKGW